MPLSLTELHRLAALGAQARLKEIEAERAAILRAFPQASTGTESSGNNAAPARRRRRRMSTAQRKVHSERMKKIWAERKKRAG